MTSSTDRPDPEATLAVMPIGLLVGLAATIGFVSAILFPVCVRLSKPLVSETTAVLPLVLTIALLGAGVGIVLSIARRSAVSQTLAAALSLAGVATILPYALGDRIAILALLLRPLATTGGMTAVISEGLATAFIAFPASVAVGYLLSRLLTVSWHRTAIAAGLGAILGSVANSFGPVPALSLFGVLKIAASLLALIGAATTIVEWRAGGFRRSHLLAFALAGLAMALCIDVLRATGGPSEFWIHGGVGNAGTEAGNLPTRYDHRNHLRRAVAEQRREISWTVDGVETGVAFEKSGGGYRLDGRAVGGLRDAPGDVMSGLIGAALHPSPRHVLVLGLGSGTSAGWLAALPEVERVDVIENEPALERIAGLSAPLHRNALSNPKVRLHRTRARAYLRSSRETYDLILAPRFDPAIVEAAAARLKPEGLFLQRVRSAGATDDRGIADALEAVFPAVETWRTQADELVLIAGHKPTEHDLERIRTLVSQPLYRDALDWLWGVAGAEGFYTGWEASILPRGVSELDGAAIADLRQIRDLAWGQLPANLNVATSRESARRAFQQGDLRRALVDWTTVGGSPESPLDQLLVAESSAEFADDRVPERVMTLHPARPVDAEAILARWHARRRAPDEALRHLLAAFRAAESHPWAYPPTLMRSLLLAEELATENPAHSDELFAALEEPFALGLLDEERLRTRIELAGPDDAARCVEAFGAFEPHPPWEEDFLHRRLRCYELADHPLAKHAQRDLRSFRQATPPRLDDGLLPGGEVR